MLRALLHRVFRLVARVYFREIEVAGEIPVATTGGRLFAANHVNGLVDPILVLTQSPCPISPIAKSTLWNIPGLAWLLDGANAVPIVRRRDAPQKTGAENDEVFARISGHLGTRGNVLIFPEGTSHNEPHLLPLRSGAGRMLARAHAESPGAALTFQAVGLEFDARDVFRSRALVLFGPVRAVRDLPNVDLASEITRVLERDLKELLLESTTWDEHLLLVRVASMMAVNATREDSLLERNRFGPRLEAARAILAQSSPSELETMEARVRAYAARLDKEALSDEAIARFYEDPRRSPDPERLVRVARALAMLPLAIVGAVLYALPYQAPRFVARRVGGDPDVTSTYKLGVGLVVFPVWGLALLVTAWLMAPTLPLALFASALVVSTPFAALPWLDRWDHLSIRAAWLAPSEERRERLAELAAERRAIMQALAALEERTRKHVATANHG
jgi:glycerol-3-phosphate O-acyltransferase/dihydroxyacetone phosphate acyltransferase